MAPGSSRGGLLIACLLFSIFHNLTESSVFDRDSPVQVFLMLTLALLGLEGQRRAPTPVAPGLASA